jgi:hypothetical protein
MDTDRKIDIRLVLVFLIVIIIVMLILYFVKLPGPITSIEKKGPYKLNDPRKLFENDSFKTNSSVSFQGFFYIEALQKTGIMKNCSDSDPSKPNCNTGRYALCACTGADCSNCYHSEYVPLIDFNDKTVVFEFLSAPDASRQNKAYTQITVKTQASEDIRDNSYNPVSLTANASSSYLYMETFVLPPIPFQKWIMITINREGRRFDIYYNDVLILSKMTSAPIYNSSISKDIVVGSTKMNGSCGMFSLYSTSQSAGDISKQYRSLISTRDSPLFDTIPPTIDWKTLSVETIPLDSVPSINASLPSVSASFLCVGSDCIKPPSAPPSKPYYEWSTSYG